MKITAIDKKARIMIVAGAFYTSFFSLHTHFSSAAKEKLVVIIVFLSKLDHRALPISYTLLVRVRKFQLLLFYSELNEVRGRYF